MSFASAIAIWLLYAPLQDLIFARFFKRDIAPYELSYRSVDDRVQTGKRLNRRIALSTTASQARQRSTVPTALTSHPIASRRLCVRFTLAIRYARGRHVYRFVHP
jgi:hypothetical protein